MKHMNVAYTQVTHRQSLDKTMDSCCVFQKVVEVKHLNILIVIWEFSIPKREASQTLHQLW